MSQLEAYRGLPLFMDVTDRDIQTNNRAAMMANCLEENTFKARVSPKGLSLVLGYFNSLPVFDRAAVHEAFQAQLVKRGLITNVQSA